MLDIVSIEEPGYPRHVGVGKAGESRVEAGAAGSVPLRFCVCCIVSQILQHSFVCCKNEL